MRMCSGAPPSTCLDISMRKRPLDPVRDASIEAENGGRADPAFAETVLQRDEAGSFQCTKVRFGRFTPFGASLVPFVQGGEPDGRLVLTELCVEAGSLCL